MVGADGTGFLDLIDDSSAQTTIHLKKGFNLIAIPEDVTSMPDLKDWLPVLGDSLKIKKVMVYDGQAGKFITLIPMEDKEDIERFKEIGWGLRTWDQWEWNDCDKRFGDDWPGRIPAQLIAHILYYFSNQNDLVLDPMAGGGVTPDTCLALSRKCWAFDMTDRLDTRPEIEPHSWTHSSDQQLSWPVSSKKKPTLSSLTRHTLTKKPPTMTGQANPDCRKKNTLNSLRNSLLS